MQEYPTKATYHYTIQPGEWDTWSVEVYHKDCNAPVTLQSDTRTNWRAVQISVETWRTDTPERLALALKTVRAIWNAHDKNREHKAYTQAEKYSAHLTMWDVAAALQTMKAVQVAHDSRVYPSLVTRDSALPDDWSQWMDALPSDTNRGRYAVVAETEEQAHKLIMAEAAGNGATTDWITSFAAAGMPVKRSEFAKPPTFNEWPIMPDDA